MTKSRKFAAISIALAALTVACSDARSETSPSTLIATSTADAPQEADSASTVALDTTVPTTQTGPPTTETTAPTDTDDADDTILVPFYTVDRGFPAGWTCNNAIPGFNVAFTSDSGERSIVEARFENASRPVSESTNAACAVETIDGAPVLLIAAQLTVPRADSYQLIETRYPFAGGVGSDRYLPSFEMVTAEEAQAGLYLGDGPLDPSDAAGLPFPAVE
ncbi:MAG: hypothetical protein AAGF73_19255 [Actinomycetota bacterium]